MTDVIAVMEVADKELSRLGYHEVAEARAAVAELIEAVKGGGGRLEFDDVAAHRLAAALRGVQA